MDDSVKRKLDHEIQRAAEEIQEDFDDIKVFWKAYKKDGPKGFAKAVPGLWDDLQRDPEIFAEATQKKNKGANTSEFYFVLAFFITAILTQIRAFTIDVNSIPVMSLGFVVSTYIICRTVMKACYDKNTKKIT